MKSTNGIPLDREQVLEDALVQEKAYWSEYLANCNSHDQADTALERMACIDAALDAPLPEELR